MSSSSQESTKCVTYNETNILQKQTKHHFWEEKKKKNKIKKNKTFLGRKTKYDPLSKGLSSWRAMDRFGHDQFWET